MARARDAAVLRLSCEGGVPRASVGFDQYREGVSRTLRPDYWYDRSIPTPPGKIKITASDRELRDISLTWWVRARWALTPDYRWASSPDPLGLVSALRDAESLWVEADEGPSRPFWAEASLPLHGLAEVTAHMKCFR